MATRIVALSVLALVLGPGTAPAGFLIQIGSATASAGGGATIDVNITGDVGNTDLLGYYLAAFRISPLDAAPAGGAQFLDPQTDAYATAAGSGYVLLGNSAFYTRDVTTFATANDTLTVGGLAAGPGENVNGGRLLARLQLTVGPGVSGGSRYRIWLDPNASDFQRIEPDSPVLFGSSDGELQVLGPINTAPAPGGLVLVAAGLPVACAGLRVLRGRGVAPAAA